MPAKERESRAVVALDLTGRLALQGQDAARGLRLWTEHTDVDLHIIDLGESKSPVSRLYATWTQSETDIVLLPYGSGAVRSALAGVTDRRLVWNHGGSDDELARPWAPMVLAPASTYFVPLVDVAARRGCETVTIVRGSGGFAARVTEGAVRRARHLGLSSEVLAVGDGQLRRTDEGGALLVVGRFEDDIAAIAGLEERPRLTGCVAAGIPAFGDALGDRADGILGPAQWWAASTKPELGPSGREFADRYRSRYGRDPSYVAAQAAAAGWLALAAAERSLSLGEVGRWSTSTLLGAFDVDGHGRQVGHGVTVVEWEHGRLMPVPPGRSG